MTTHHFVSIKAIAERLGLDKSAALKAVKRAGFTPVKHRTPDSGNQAAACLPESEADLFVAMREQGGSTPGVKRNLDGNCTANDAGEFYVIELVPGYTGDVKLGFSESTGRRLQEHRTSAPRCRVLGTFPCLRGWEKTAIASITRNGCQQIGPEAFVYTDVREALVAAEAFFALMPEVGYRPELAEESPLNT